ncbi:NAD-dependent epimerase/dehydratase family protein [Butyrivibrio sp. XBB1001]|uniref:NAD-dependent epimerase/dehydratase family protein n=1 Tax=Butyrivibrio sp. XBB1001 TaxID=1280682 RepID=UPI0004031F18|nr:NAD-dependent epimerase/dehydratase family protein [Butyrivibrio sp. XBB1001]
MKALFIGGTGTISMGIIRKLAEDPMWEVYLLNRGNRKAEVPECIKQITADIGDEADVAKKLDGMKFDVVSDFIAFDVSAVERDYRLFKDKTRQYIFISSASAYNTPASSYIITEGTTLANPYWEYSRNKIACEEFLMEKYRKEQFPVTIVRPSHTYDERSVPLGVHGNKGFYQVIRRMQQGKKVLIQGDGSSLWHLTFNSDFAVGFIGLMGNSHALGEAFQITGDEVLTWNQIYQTIADALGVELKPYYVTTDLLSDIGGKYGYDFRGSLMGDKSVSVVFDNSKVKKLSPTLTTTVPFHKGVRIALDYVLSHPEKYEEDPEFDNFCDKVISTLDKAREELLGNV